MNEVYNILKEYLSEKLAKEAAEKICGIPQPKSVKPIDVKDITDDTPDGALFTMCGKTYVLHRYQTGGISGATPIKEEDDFVSIDKINKDTPDGTRFMLNGVKYITSKTLFNACDIIGGCAVCPFDGKCVALPFGFIKVK